MSDERGAIWAFLSLRLFLALRWIISAVEKFELNQTYSFANYHANMQRLGEGISSSSFLPTWLTVPYSQSLGFVTFGVGLLLLLGVKTRWMLILTALLYISLACGLMAAEDNEGVAWLAIHVGLAAAALHLARHNRWALTRD